MRERRKKKLKIRGEKKIWRFPRGRCERTRKINNRLPKTENVSCANGKTRREKTEKLPQRRTLQQSAGDGTRCGGTRMNYYLKKIPLQKATKNFAPLFRVKEYFYPTNGSICFILSFL
ncbi:uncharacterized protein LOC112691733 [Sipha flava]|uniref:Uncharacterized protein LOC112691733 n=1 Tax=Sipha flava TaxID=143950 RepID=A0A8B8GH24_9HEMI|nr:uncharacterized protein LOC112691733 [Sipha flava]